MTIPQLLEYFISENNEEIIDENIKIIWHITPYKIDDIFITGTLLGNTIPSWDGAVLVNLTFNEDEFIQITTPVSRISNMTSLYSKIYDKIDKIIQINNRIAPIFKSHLV